MPTDAVNAIELHYDTKQRDHATSLPTGKGENLYLRSDLAWANFDKVMSIGKTVTPAIRDV